jgi:hypothetical protein
MDPLALLANNQLVLRAGSFIQTLHIRRDTQGKTLEVVGRSLPAAWNQGRKCIDISAPHEDIKCEWSPSLKPSPEATRSGLHLLLVGKETSSMALSSA